MSKTNVLQHITGSVDGYYFGEGSCLIFTDKKLEEGSYSCVKVDRLPKPDTIKITTSDGSVLPSIGVTDSGLVVIGSRTSKDYEEVTISFEEADLPLPIETFNTIEGLDEYIKDLRSLNEIIQARIIYGRLYGERLNEFVVNRIVYLDCFGQSFVFNEITFENKEFYKLGKVETLNKFNMYNPSYSYGGKYIPLFDDVCEQCGETFNMDDLSSISSTWYSRKLMHDGCIGHHYYETEKSIVEQIINGAYPDGNCSLRGIKSRYSTDKNGHNRPWFKVKTPDGDILIGQRKRVFSITWEDSYKPFSEAFDFVDDTKGFGTYGDERYIHAYSIEKAIEYLKLAKNSIR